MKRLLLSTLVAATPFFSGCHKTSDQNQTELPSATVRDQTVERKSRAATEDVVGTVRPKLSAAIEAKVSGRIEQMLVVPGQLVKAGDRLVLLDAHEIQSRLDQAAAARQQAESDLKRATDLIQQKILSQSEFDNTQSKYRIAVATEAEAKTMLNYTLIVAPFNGVITRKLADVGDLAAPGKPLIAIEDPSALQLEADVPQAIASHVQRDARLAVRVDGVSGELTGTVSEIAPAADSVSRTFRVKVDFSDQPGLSSGQFARLLVPVGESNSLRVPVSAVVQRGQLEIVFAVANQHAQLHLVKTGKPFGDETEILSGLHAGDAVVVEGAAQLTDGQPVETK